MDGERGREGGGRRGKMVNDEMRKGGRREGKTEVR